MKDVYTNIGMNIRNARMSRGMTQSDLANRMETSQAMIAQYEKGTKKLSLEKIIKLTEALDVNFNEIINDDEHKHLYKMQPDHYKMWIEEIGTIEFRKDEIREIIEFVKYVLYKREVKKGTRS